MKLTRPEHETLNEVFTKVAAERIRQRQLLDDGVIPVDLFLPDSLSHSLSQKLVFLTEELGEVAKAVRNKTLELESSHRFNPSAENLETELIQLATHTCVWRASRIQEGSS